MTVNSTSGSSKEDKASAPESREEGLRRVVPEGDSSSSSTDTTQSETSKAEISISETQGVRLGKCKWFNVAKGWGFIKPNDGGQDVFVHQSVIQMPGFRSLGEQEDVEFECVLTERGLEASRVSAPGGEECRGSTFRPRPKRRFRRIRCYNCGAFANHIAAKCSLGPQPKRCHYCKSEDHLVANCLKKKEEEEAGISSKDTTEKEKLQPEHEPDKPS